jgi:hypothetical protein
MHYKNGRAAKAGDRVVQVRNGVASGILHSVNAEATTCNGRVSPLTGNEPYVTISDCLHVDDVAKADVPDSSQGA